LSPVLGDLTGNHSISLCTCSHKCGRQGCQKASERQGKSQAQLFLFYNLFYKVFLVYQPGVFFIIIGPTGPPIMIRKSKESDFGGLFI
jgi:hypothetical protein